MPSKDNHKQSPVLRNLKNAGVRLSTLRKYNGDPRRPTTMHVGITDRCNMSCPYCLYKNDNKNFKVLNAVKALSLISEIDSSVILLSGGEPLIFGDILDTTRTIVRSCREAGKITGVLTNGITLKSVLEKDFPEFIPGSRFFFQISVDGLREEHNKLRGHFDLIMKNIGHAKSAGHLIYTNTVVSKRNINSLHEMVKFISGFSDRVYLNPMVNNDDTLTLDETDLKRLGDYIINRQDLKVANSINFGKFLKGEQNLKCMFHSLVSVTPSGKLKFPCYCYAEGSEYLNSFQEYLNKVYQHRKRFEERLSPQCRTCYNHCLHESYVYAQLSMNEIIEQMKRPKNLYKKYIRPLFKFACRDAINGVST
ncbi:MAG: radical SAM protein [Nitrospirae bacterium]|nr:radical SAM protein [Nitrospirota bacterium]